VRALSAGLLIVGAAVVVLGILAVVAGVQSRPAVPVRAVEVHPTVGAAVTPTCDSTTAVVVSFRWHGQTVKEPYENFPCDRSYSAGETLTAFVASNDPSNIQPHERWILHPDEYDPFDAFGPNDSWVALVVLGGVVVGLGGAALVLGTWRGFRRQ